MVRILLLLSLYFCILFEYYIMIMLYYLKSERKYKFMFIVGKTRENDRALDDFFFFKKIESRIMKKITFKSLN